MSLRLRKTCMILLAASSFVLASAETSGGEAGKSPRRRTALAQVVERCAPSAVDMMTIKAREAGRALIGWGAGTIIHEAGYVLTNDHVASEKDERQIMLQTGQAYFYETLVRMPDLDIAVVKIDADVPLAPMKLGRSNDLMVGEPVVVIGNPTGLPHTVTNGVVSALNRGDRGLIQTDAPINFGNSGGPMLNVFGELIGVVGSKEVGQEGLGYAIPIDHVRGALADWLADREKYEVRLGLTVDTFGPAVVTQVAADAPAAKAGVEVGDIIRRVGAMRVGDGVDYCIAMMGRKAGEEVVLAVERGRAAMTFAVPPIEVPPRPAEQAEGLVNGLKVVIYGGSWLQLPDFDGLTPAGGGRVATFTHTVHDSVQRLYGLVFTGYVEVPADGLYTFYTVSDDGSRLWIGDRMIVANDMTHQARERGGSIRLAAGKHPIRVTYFDAGGGRTLQVLYEGPNLPRQEIPESALFSKP